MTLGFKAGRSVATPEYRSLLPDDTAHVCEYFDGEVARSAYWELALALTASASIVFFDPDNGIGAGDTPLTVSYEELGPFYRRGQSLVIYQHQDRKKGGIAALASDRALGLHRHLGADEVLALRWHRYQTRLFFVVPAARHREVLRARVGALLASPWGSAIRRRWPDFTDASIVAA